MIFFCGWYRSLWISYMVYVIGSESAPMQIWFQIRVFYRNCRYMHVPFKKSHLHFWLWYWVFGHFRELQRSFESFFVNPVTVAATIYIAVVLFVLKATQQQIIILWWWDEWVELIQMITSYTCSTIFVFREIETTTIGWGWDWGKGREYENVANSRSSSHF